MKNFLSYKDVGDLEQLLEDASAFKQAPLLANTLGKGKTMVMLFLNPSLRTRLSTQKAAIQLGMNCIVMNVGQDGWQLEFEDGVVMNGSKAEHIREAAGVVSQYADIIGIRTFAGLTDRSKDYSEEVLTNFCKYATVPVLNLESATVHPLQSLADLMTIVEHKQSIRPKVVVTWAPHPRALPQAVANSFLEWMYPMEFELSIVHPPGYELAEAFVCDLPVSNDQREAFKDADFIYAKNWSSYTNYGQQPVVRDNWMVTKEKMDLTNRAKFMHCLPVRRNVVVEDAVLNSAESLVLQQAANRQWAAQAVLKQLLINQ